MRDRSAWPVFTGLGVLVGVLCWGLAAAVYSEPQRAGAWPGTVTVLGFALFGALVDYVMWRRRCAERALRESERRFRMFAEAAFEGIIVSRDGVIEDASECFARIVGYELDELIGKSIREFLAPRPKR